jgi:hypothetical protein
MISHSREMVNTSPLSEGNRRRYGGNRPPRDLDVEGRVILIWMAWTGLRWLRITTGGRLLWTQQWTQGFSHARNLLSRLATISFSTSTLLFVVCWLVSYVYHLSACQLSLREMQQNTEFELAAKSAYSKTSLIRTNWERIFVRIIEVLLKICPGKL